MEGERRDGARQRVCTGERRLESLGGGGEGCFRAKAGVGEGDFRARAALCSGAETR